MSWDDYAEGRPAKRRKIQPSLHKKAPTSNSAPRPFRFFDLPRELRDEIYDLMLDNRIEVLGHVHEAACLYMENGPRLSALQVSRQFATEYTEQMRRSAVLCAYADSPAELLGTSIPSLFASCCAHLVVWTSAYQEGETHTLVQGTNHLSKQFCNLSTLSLDARVWQGSLEVLTQCPGVSKIDAYLADNKGEWSNHATWNSKTGGDDSWVPVATEPDEWAEDYVEEQVESQDMWLWGL